MRKALLVLAFALVASFAIPKQANATSCGTLDLSRAFASGYQSTSPPGRVIDGDPKTGWASNGIGSWIIVDLGSPKMVCSVDIAWYRGDLRVAHFAILTSLDGESYREAYIHGRSSGMTKTPERYSFEPTGTRYVQVKVYGNTENNWAAIMEIDVQGYVAGTIIHTVAAGEYLSKIAMQYNVPWLDIAKRNNLSSPYLIYPGDRLEINPLLAEKTCSDGWNITAYFTPLESEYSGTGLVSVQTNEGKRTYYQGFVDEIMMQGSGRTNNGDYLGYWGGGFHISKEPRTSSGLVVKIGHVATDTSVIPYFTKIAIPTMKEPWNKMTFTAADTGPAIIGKHLDVYTGIGLDAREEAFRVAGKSQTVCY